MIIFEKWTWPEIEKECQRVWESGEKSHAAGYLFSSVYQQLKWLITEWANYEVIKAMRANKKQLREEAILQLMALKNAKKAA